MTDKRRDRFISADEHARRSASAKAYWSKQENRDRISAQLRARHAAAQARAEACVSVILDRSEIESNG